MHILVFRTNLHNLERVNALAPHLENINGIIKWNVDLKDVDNVLRIECNSLSADAISSSVQQAGYFCEELPG
jgi:hypothetical protein